VRFPGVVRYASRIGIEEDRRPDADPTMSRGHSVVVLGKPTDTNGALVAAFAAAGHTARLSDPGVRPLLTRGDVALGRVDVLPTLDGVEPGLWELARLERRGAHLLNGPHALFAAHDKLTTALFLGRAGVAQPRTAHVSDMSVPSFPPPYVVKPRFGSWGQEVHLCRDEDELLARLEGLHDRRWFRRQGALVQSLVEPTGRDLRVVVAAGRVVGAIERVALPGEWRTNVSLGAVRRRSAAPLPARALARRAVEALGLDLAGVDIATDHAGRMLVLEINGAVDFTQDYGDDIFAATAYALLRRAATGAEARSPRPAVVGLPKLRAAPQAAT
jgi:RimK family alpha-L-glutamate ligase